ncbi:MAG: DUF421 domain-containing protein [Clostridia bacterium]
MLVLFLRAIFMYLFVFFVLRLTGKRQVADLQPFDLLITLLIADLAGSCIADTGIPLLYSVVPVLGMYFVQQLVTHICLKNARARRVVCGSPMLLIYDGVVQEQAMRQNNYTLIDLLDQLRSKNIFDLSMVAFAVLETNGSMSVLTKDAYAQPTRADFKLPAVRDGLCWMLILDGELCHDAIKRLALNEAEVEALARDMAGCKVRDVFFLHQSADGTLHLQKKLSAGGTCCVREGHA